MSLGIEYLTYGDNLGYAADFEWIGDRFILGLGYLYSSSEGESSRSLTHISRYSFFNHGFSLPVLIRLGKERDIELGLSYTFMRSKVDYFDLYPSVYAFRFRGLYDQHFAGLHLAWRYIHHNGFFLRPSFRLGMRVADREIPVEKEAIYYDPNARPEEDFHPFLIYTTFRMNIGFIPGYAR